MENDKIEFLDKDKLALRGVGCVKLQERLFEMNWANFDDLDEAEGSVEQWAEVFEETPALWRAIALRDKIIGYWNYLVFNAEYEKRMIDGDLLEKDMTVEALEKNLLKAGLNLYLDSFCVDAPFQNNKISGYIMKSMYDVIGRLIASGAKFGKVWASAWSEKGESFLKKLGFEFYKSNKFRGEICFVTFETFYQKLGDTVRRYGLSDYFTE